MAIDWRVYGPDTVAARLDKAELPGFFKDVVVGPNEVALIVRNGKIDERLEEGRHGTSGWRDRVKGLFGRADDVSVYYVDSSPISLKYYLGKSHRSESSSTSSGDTSRLDTTDVVIVALTADGKVVQAEIQLGISVRSNDVDLLTGLFKGRAALSTWDVAASIRDEILGKVMIPKIASLNSVEIRGNRALLGDIKANIEEELQDTFDNWAFELGSFNILWGLTEEEESERVTSRIEREAAAVTFEHDRRVSDLRREAEIDRLRIINLAEAKKMEAEGEEELRDFHLLAEINRDQLVAGGALVLQQVGTQIRALELDVDRQEAVLRIEIEEAQSKNDHSRRIRDAELDQKIKANEANMENERRRQEQQLVHEKNLQSQKQTLEQSNDKNKAEMDDLWQLVLIQAQRKLDKQNARLREAKEFQDLEIEKDAVAHRRILETSQQSADNDFRVLKIKAEEIHARIASEDKILLAGVEAGAMDPEVMKALIRGNTDRTGSDASNVARAGADAAVGNQSVNGTPNPVEIEGKCLNCSEKTKPNWKECPRCEFQFNCIHCGEELKPKWKRCPECSTPVAETSSQKSNDSCGNCGSKFQPDWQFCGDCGTARE